MKFSRDAAFYDSLRDRMLPAESILWALHPVSDVLLRDGGGLPDSRALHRRPFSKPQLPIHPPLATVAAHEQTLLRHDSH